MPSKKPNSIYDRDGNFDIELYVIRTTRASKVPLKIEDPTVLRMVESLLNKGKTPKKAPRKVRDVQLPHASEPAAPPPPVEQRLQNLEGQIGTILSLLEDKSK